MKLVGINLRWGYDQNARVWKSLHCFQVIGMKELVMFPLNHIRSRQECRPSAKIINSSKIGISYSSHQMLKWVYVIFLFSTCQELTSAINCGAKEKVKRPERTCLHGEVSCHRHWSPCPLLTWPGFSWKLKPWQPSREVVTTFSAPLPLTTPCLPQGHSASFLSLQDLFPAQKPSNTRHLVGNCRTELETWRLFSYR